jgi:hypothetical protein
MDKTFIIATALMAVALTGILSTSSLIFAQIVPETEQEQELDQEFIVSGESTNNGCAALNLPGGGSPPPPTLLPPSDELAGVECGVLDSAPPPPSLLPSSQP